ncbi:MAG: uL15m family ribosomal protein [Candidatus Heimdallarchaeaceae archaeon]
MTVRTRKKVRKRRGSRTHGWGVIRTHRKSGMRGGVGKSGPKSRHWIQVIKGLRPPIGKRGFIRPQAIDKKIKTINISHLEAMLPTLIKNEKAIQKGKSYEINLKELGYKKLLAQGQVSTPLVVTVKRASEKAIEKIEAAGGKVIIEE